MNEKLIVKFPANIPSELIEKNLKNIQVLRCGNGCVVHPDSWQVTYDDRLHLMVAECLKVSWFDRVKYFFTRRKHEV